LSENRLRGEGETKDENQAAFKNEMNFETQLNKKAMLYAVSSSPKTEKSPDWPCCPITKLTP
jgi:hypothetical protein